MSLICSYFQSQIQAEEQYGPRTVVLMQIGSFYEIYEYDPQYCADLSARTDSTGKVWSQHIGHAVEISRILNSVLTFQDNNRPYSIHNPNKMGFPYIAYEKNRDTLLSANYVIVRIDQDNKPTSQNKTVHRSIAEVVSPTMELSTSAPSNNIVCLYLEYQKGTPQRPDSYLLTIGLALVDTLTGENKIGECYSRQDDSSYALQEIYRLLLQLYPREVRIYLQDIPLDQRTTYGNYLEQILNLSRYERHTLQFQEVPKDYAKVDYQLTYLQKIFTPTISNILHIRKDNILTELHLETFTYGRLAYILLLHFIETYNPQLLLRLHQPHTQWIDDHHFCILAHNALEQLDILPPPNSTRNKAINSLFSIVNLTRTAGGKRLLLHLLTNPLIHKSDIESYYQRVHELTVDNIWQQLDHHLKELPDIERLHRKIELETILPKELTTINRAYTLFVQMYIDILNLPIPHIHAKLLTPAHSHALNQCLQYLNTRIIWSEMECASIRVNEKKERWLEFVNSPFVDTYLPSEVRKHLSEYSNARIQIQSILHHLTTMSNLQITLTESKRKVGVALQDPPTVYISCTNSVANKILAINYDVSICGNLQAHSRSASEKMITSEILDVWLQNMNNAKNCLRYELYQYYVEIIRQINNFTFFSGLARVIAEVDVCCCYAHVSRKYNYHQPVILEGKTFKVQARELRHPISEIIEEGLYVPNDVSLDASGMLLFGVNQTGKSSLAKSLAMNILLAQAGCYTAGKLEYVPCKRIITRLRHSDNLYERKSTFAVEMLELRTILRQADEYTLVIGDELCHGTEKESGLAITASTVATLSQRGTSFIFATHMHDLVQLPIIKSIDKLRIAHLTVSEENGLLIYERKLQEGSGSTFYGLIVAQSLGLPMDVIEQAYEILRGEETIQTSRYNRKLYVQECAECGAKDNLQTHHIQEQKNADANGFIGPMHKNSKHNLIVLCASCHTNLHHSGHNLQAKSSSQGILITKVES